MGKKVILLANLGSPDSFSVPDVKKYLSEFLMDGRVIDIPYLLRYLLVKGIIVPFRAPKSAEKYRSIWTSEGSPLICITEEITSLLEKKSNVPVYMCMRYGNPTPHKVLKKIHAEHSDIEELIVLPLYPHYAMSSFETAVEHIKAAFAEGNYNSALRIVKPFYNHPSYLEALKESLIPYLENKYDHILFSYHGIPERHVQKTDPSGTHCLKSSNCCTTDSVAHQFCYRHQVFETTEKIAASLGLIPGTYSVSFQSRLGKDKWLSPDTATELKRLPESGKKNILIICPAFVSDCLETLEEIMIEGKEIFMHAGGENFTYVPCMNTSDKWIEAMETLCLQN